jgi:hypothetical protein
MNCPNCDHTTHPGQLRCGHCNYKLPETTPAQPSAAGEPASVPCWNCLHPNVAEALRCGHCNAKNPGEGYQRHKPVAAAPRADTVRRNANPMYNLQLHASHDE